MKIFMPGPVPVREETRRAMSHEMISHRGKDASDWQKMICSYMQQVWQTGSQILCSSSSGTGLMEGALSSCAGEKTAVFAVGAFGERFADIAEGLGIPVSLYKKDWGSGLDLESFKEVAESGNFDTIVLTHNETSTGVMNPLEACGEIMRAHPEILWIVDSVSGTGGSPLRVDDWGIDIAITSTQKCLGLPPGMAFCTFSDKARARAEGKANRGYYFDLLKLSDYANKKDQYPSTPNISLMAAALVQLKYVVEEEGLENRYQRHLALQEKVHNWVKDYGVFFAEEGFRSPTVTAIALAEGKDVTALLGGMKKKGYALSSGYGRLKGKTFRIAHMADCSLEDMDEMLQVLTETYHEI